MSRDSRETWIVTDIGPKVDVEDGLAEHVAGTSAPLYPRTKLRKTRNLSLDIRVVTVMSSFSKFPEAR